MIKTYGIVYFILNTINGKMYIGQTIQSLKRRFSEHVCHKKSAIGKAIRKYGKENFRCGVIKSCASKAEMDYWEKFFIIALNTKGHNGYNQTDGGEGIGGCTEEIRAEMSVKRTGDKNGFFGKHHKKETCSALSVIKRAETPYQNLLAEMDKRQLTYSSMTEIFGTNISRKMRGERNFTESQVAKLVEIFNKPAEYLLARNDGLPTILSRHHKTFYRNLLNEINRRQFTYTSLANLLGLSQQTLSDKMSGKRKFKPKDKKKLVEIFDKPIEYLMFKEEFL